MKSVIVVFMVLLTSANSRIYNTWHVRNYSKYWIAYETVNSFTQAEEACRAMNAHLAYVNTSRIQSYLQNKIGKPAKNGPQSFYIGAKRVPGTNSFKWTDETNVARQYPNQWQTYEPNNVKNIEDCVTMGWKDAYYSDEKLRWCDIPCNYSSRYICEKPSDSLNPTTTTTTTTTVPTPTKTTTIVPTTTTTVFNVLTTTTSNLEIAPSSVTRTSSTYTQTDIPDNGTSVMTGIIVAVVIAIVILLVFIFVMLWRRRNTRRDKPRTPSNAAAPEAEASAYASYVTTNQRGGGGDAWNPYDVAVDVPPNNGSRTSQASRAGPSHLQEEEYDHLHGGESTSGACSYLQQGTRQQDTYSQVQKASKQQDTYSQVQKASRQEDTYSQIQKTSRQQDTYSQVQKASRQEDTYSQVQKASKQQDTYSQVQHGCKDNETYSKLQLHNR